MHLIGKSNLFKPFLVSYDVSV